MVSRKDFLSDFRADETLDKPLTSTKMDVDYFKQMQEKYLNQEIFLIKSFVNPNPQNIGTIANQLNKLSKWLDNRIFDLTHCVNNNCLSSVEYLLEQGTDVNCPSNLPLYLAVVRGQREMVSLLLAHGALPELEMIERSRSPEIQELLTTALQQHASWTKAAK